MVAWLLTVVLTLLLLLLAVLMVTLCVLRQRWHTANLSQIKCNN